MKASEKFWQIAHLGAALHGKSDPRKRYDSYAEAKTAAERTATTSGQPYAVLECTHVAQPGDDATPQLI